MQGKHHKGHKHEESKGKWRNKVKKISELLTVMDKMQAPGGLPFVNAQDISACEDLLEAYFMQVGKLHNQSGSFLAFGFCLWMLSRLKGASSAVYLSSACNRLQQGLLHEHAVHAGSPPCSYYPTTICFWRCVAQLAYVMSVSQSFAAAPAPSPAHALVGSCQQGLLPAELAGVQPLFPF